MFGHSFCSDVPPKGHDARAEQEHPGGRQPGKIQIWGREGHHQQGNLPECLKIHLTLSNQATGEGKAGEGDAGTCSCWLWSLKV